MIWTAEKLFKGRTVAILAGGPSMLKFEREQVQGCYVIAINDSWRLYPADINYFCDGGWWHEQLKSNRKSVYNICNAHVDFRLMSQFSKWVKGGVEDAHDLPDHVRVLKFTGQTGLETDPRGLRHGSNSGYQAINLAYHLGASRILLFGYDMHCEGVRTHWHDGPRQSSTVFAGDLSRSMLPLFSFLVEPLERAGVTVLNATPGSALTCWPEYKEEKNGIARSHHYA